MFAVPAPVDLLRKPSVTSVVDTVASVFQVIMVAAGCALQNGACRRSVGKGWRGGIAFVTAIAFMLCHGYYGVVNFVI